MRVTACAWVLGSCVLTLVACTDQDALPGTEPTVASTTLPMSTSGNAPGATTEPSDAERDWQLIAEVDGNLESPAVLITDDTGLQALWSQLDIPGQPPTVGWSSHVVLALEIAHGVGEECDDAELLDVVVDQGVVHADVWHEHPADGMCPAGRDNHTYVLAVRRQLLPSPPFTVKAEADYAGGLVVTQADLEGSEG